MDLLRIVLCNIILGGYLIDCVQSADTDGHCTREGEWRYCDNVSALYVLQSSSVEHSYIHVHVVCVLLGGQSSKSLLCVCVCAQAEDGTVQSAAES